MLENIAKFCLILSCVFGLEKVHATELFPFFIPRQDGSILEGYFSPPDTSSSPIVFAIQGSSCKSAYQWHMDLCNQAHSLGMGLIVLEKQGISKESVNLLEYSQTNCLQKRLEDYVFCLENMDAISPGWNGKAIFWGESEGGMLAASLADQRPETAAVLLFATGGGMKPREEVKWVLRHRLEEHGALPDEVDQYMDFLDRQMDEMILEPTPNKQFLGNTYKWWGSLLAADEVLTSLNRFSFPIFLVHGVEDREIPVLSADLAAEILKKTGALTYLRLEGYGHELDHINIQAAAYQWLRSILFGQGQPDNSSIAAEPSSLTAPSADWKRDILHYVFNRGGGEVSASVEAGGDTDGNTYASGSVGVSSETDGGMHLEVHAELSVEQDCKRPTPTWSGR